MSVKMVMHLGGASNAPSTPRVVLSPYAGGDGMSRVRMELDMEELESGPGGNGGPALLAWICSWFTRSERWLCRLIVVPIPYCPPMAKTGMSSIIR